MTRRLMAALLLVATTACAHTTNGTGPTPSMPAATTAPASPTSSVPTAASTTVATPALLRTIASYAAKPLAWTGCGDGFQCATMTVPLDYDHTGLGTIGVAVIRLASTGRATRIGSLLLNPGGPGGSGVEFARQARQLLPQEMLDRFDVVSFDPRGVGQSAPVKCLTDRQLDRILAVDPSPDTPAEHAALFAANKEEATACQRRAARLLPHVSTRDAARDMEVLRGALHEPKLTYVGFSYGTILGARYAEQFPTHVRAFVLDGAVDPSLSPSEVGLAQAEGFEQALRSFFADCVQRRCPFASHGDIGTTFDRLMASIDASPLDAGSYPGRKLGPSEALFGVAAGLYSKEFYWSLLRSALEQAYAAHDGSGLFTLFDNLVERDRNGHYSNSIEAQTAISCVDASYPREQSAYDADARRFAPKAPRFGVAVAYGAAFCAYWPVPAVTTPHPVTAPGAPPILTVGTTRDPATPYAWAVALNQQLPGALLTHDGDGHTAYGYGRSACTNRVVDKYLIDLVLPAAGTRCS